MSKKKKITFYNAWDDIRDHPECFFFIIIGPRGTGKTYGFLKEAAQNNIHFMYNRRIKSELDVCCTPNNNPFKSINRDLHVNFEMKKDGEQLYAMYNCNDPDNPIYIGEGTALTTFANVRGADFSDCNVILEDEFINTAPRNSLKPEAEFTAWSNMIETINRNRELLEQPLPPVKVIMLGNSNGISSSGILSGLELGETIRMMKTENIETYVDKERQLFIRLVNMSALKEAKKQTALYKLTKGTKFYRMAIENEFVEENFNLVKHYKQNMLEPICRYEKISFYRIKGQDILYVNHIKNKTIQFTEENKKQFLASWGMTIAYYIEKNKIRYYDYDLKIQVENIFK